MNPEPPTGDAPDNAGPAASPVAICGVLLIMLFSITLGVLGPSVTDYRRGQFVSGQPVIDLLQGVQSVYFQMTREVSRTLRRSGSMPPSITESTLKDSLQSSFGSIDPTLLPTSSEFRIIAIDDEVDLLAFRQDDLGAPSGLSALYLPEQGNPASADGIVLLVQDLRTNRQAFYLRDEFGVPKPVEDGVLYRDLVDAFRSELSIVFWAMNGFFYVLVASEPERLDDYLESLDLAPVIEKPISSV